MPAIGRRTSKPAIVTSSSTSTPQKGAVLPSRCPVTVPQTEKEGQGPEALSGSMCASKLEQNPGPAQEAEGLLLVVRADGRSPQGPETPPSTPQHISTDDVNRRETP